MDSPKAVDTPFLNRNLSSNGLTSTPLPSVGVRRPSHFTSGIKSRLLGPRRYSLSDISSPLNGTSRTSSDSNHLGAGPLLTSTNYKDNVSLYEETKSTGLATRIVRYDEETERRKPLVQEKYNGPGLFPIVHLFKNQSNSDQSPKRTFIRIGTPDRIKCLPPPSREISSKMLEAITKPSPLKLKTQLRQLDHKTENVLDALKEISRKRILAHEDYDLHQDSSKKIRTDELQRPKSSKRLQDSDDSDQSLNTSVTQRSKKICVYDEYAASRSSSDMSFKVTNGQHLEKSNRKKISAKRKTTSTLTEDDNRSKQVKLITTETQTEPIVTKDQPDLVEKDPKPAKKPSPLRVFDAHPLENLRKNRLAALMGTIVGKDVFFQSQVQENSSEKQPISILSTNRRHSTEKHVHFDVPDANNSLKSVDSQSKPPEIISTNSIAVPVGSNDIASKPKEVSSSNLSTTESSSNLPSIASTIAASFSVGAPKPTNSVSPVVASTSVAMPSLSVTSPSTTPKVGGFKFDLDQSKTPERPKVVQSTPQLDIKSTLSNSTPTFNFGGASAATSSTENFKSSFSSQTPNIPSLGLGTTTNSQANTTITTVTFGGEHKSANIPSLGFGTTANSQANTTTTAGGEHKSANMPSLGFGATANTPGKSTGTDTFGGTLTAPSIPIEKNTPTTSTATRPMFEFAAPTASAISASFNATSAGLPVISSLPKTTTIAFGSQSAAITSTPSFGFSTSAPSITSTFGTTATTTAQSTFGFHSSATKTVATTTQSTFAFGSTAATTTAPSTFSFGSSTVTSAPSSLDTFGSKPSSGSTFGAVSSTPSFGNVTTSSFAFGTPSTTTAAPAFEVGTTKAGFGSSGQTTGFSAPSITPSFGSSTSTPAFGSTPSTAQPSASIFGANVATTTTSTTFGTPTVSASAPAFGSSQPMFGATSAPTFGAKSESNKNATFTFGGNKSSGFSSNVTNQGSAPAFGSTTQDFGQTNPQNSIVKSLFGQPTSSTLNPAFGQTNQQQTNAFGGGNNNAFGSASSGFGSTSVAQTGTSAFGGGATSTSTFGSATSNSFGAQPAVQNKSFAFGSSTTANQNTAPFAFGSNNNNNSSVASKPSFSFTGGAASTPVFGAGNSATQNPPTFGAVANPNAAAAPSFGQGGGASVVSSFGGGGASFGGSHPVAAPNPAGVGMFNIGAGASSGRSRPLAKAVRRRT